MFTVLLFYQSSSFSDSFWVGGTDLVKENLWMWATSQRRITSSRFSDWERNQPDNYRGKEHCMEIYIKTDKWNDRACHDWKKFICERDSK